VWCINNNTIIIHSLHRTIFIVQSSMAQSHMWDFTLGPLSESQAALSGHQLVDRAANLAFEPAYRLNIHPTPFVVLLNHEIDTHL